MSRAANESQRWWQGVINNGGAFFAVAVFWELAVRTMRVDARLLPAPTLIVSQTLGNFALLREHIGSTLIATLAGFGLSALVGVVVGVVLVSNRWINGMLFPLLVLSQTMPKVALAPLLLIWFGFGIKSKILVSFLMAVFPVLVDTIVGLEAMPNEFTMLARSMGAGTTTTFRRFRFPYALPYIFGGLRIAAVFAVTGTVVAEFVGAENGLVYLLSVAQGQHQTALVFGIILILSAISVMLFWMVEVIEAWTVPWYRASRGGTA